MLYKTQENEFFTIVKNSYYLKDIMRKNGYTLNIKNIKQIKKKLNELNIDTKKYSKNIIQKNNLDYNTCFKCKISNTWNGKYLVLKKININGNNKMVCPNCCSQIMFL